MPQHSPKPSATIERSTESKLPQFLRSLKKSSLRTSAFFLAAGIGLSAVLPADAARTTRPAPLESNPQQVAQTPQTVQITLVTYAVTRAAYDRIIPLFQEKWRRENNGQEVQINASYGGSGSQTRAVIDGLEADVVALALAADVNRIQRAGLIDAGWESEAPNQGILTRSVIAFVTREGNPKRIRNWSDLSRSDVRVITANPKTSGVARWNFLGLWGSVTETGGTEAQARDYVTQVYRNTPVLPADARASTEAFFVQNQGDVLLNYENEVILAAQEGRRSFSVIPQTNISIDAPVAVVDQIVDRRNTRRVAEAFVQFLYTPEAQRQFAAVGFRPVDATVTREVASRFPRVSQLYTIADFGGWNAVQTRFFDDGAIFDQIYGQR